MLRVVNRYREKEDVYIGRGSPLGNPFPITKMNSRNKVIAMYEVWLKNEIASGNTSILSELKRIKDMNDKGSVRLGCFCKPQRCHGEIVMAIVEEME